MHYVGYLIIMNGQKIYKKVVSEIYIFELQRVENHISKLCPSPRDPPPPPALQTHE